MTHNLSTPVVELSGIGKARAEKLLKLGIRTLRDLIYYFPRAYENRGDVRTLGMHDTEMPHSYVLTVASEVHSVLIKKGMTLSKFRAFDESGSCEVVFFNSPFVKDIFHRRNLQILWKNVIFKNKTVGFNRSKIRACDRGN